MNFEDMLLRGIPQGEAAAFFIQVRGVEKQAAIEDLDAAFAALSLPEQYALLKQAQAMGMTPAPASLPPTAQGRNMAPAAPPPLPPTGQGQHAKMASDKTPEELGRERARAALSAEFAREKAHTGERVGDLAGRAVGGAAGAALMHLYGGGRALPTLGGAALGQHFGGKVGREAGAAADRAHHEKTAYYHADFDLLGHPYSRGYYSRPIMHVSDYGAQRQARVMEDEQTAKRLVGQARRSGQSPEQVAAQYAAQAEEHGGTGGALLGGLLGLGLGATAGSLAGPGGTVIGGLTGGALGGLAGHSMGRSAGRHRGERMGDLMYAHNAPAVEAAPETAKAAAAMRKAAAAFKVALDELGIQPQQQQPQSDPLPGGAIEPALSPETQQYLALRQQAEQGADKNHFDFLRQKIQEAQQQAQQAQAQSQELQQQTQMLQQQQAMHAQETAGFQSQIADATQKATAAQDQILQQQQAAAAMRMAYQQLRGTLLQAASQEPPSLTGVGGSPAGMAAASQAAAPTSAPEPAAGPAGQAPSPGAAPNAVAPTGEEQNNAPAAGTEPTFAGANPASSMTQKQSHYLPFGALRKQAALKDYLATQLGKAVTVLPHATVGAAVGGGLGLHEAHADYEPLRQKVQELEGRPDRGYADTLNLAQARARLTLGEFAKQHPAVSTGMGAMSGAVLGATEGPGLVDSLQRSKEHLGAIGRNLKDVYNQRVG